MRDLIRLRDVAGDAAPDLAFTCLHRLDVRVAPGEPVFSGHGKALAVARLGEGAVQVIVRDMPAAWGEFPAAIDFGAHPHADVTVYCGCEPAEPPAPTP